MNSSFGRRLFLLTALEIVGLSWILVLAVALFAFGSYVRSVRADVETTLAQTIATAAAMPGVSANRVAYAVASGYLRSGVIVLMFDRDRRIDIYRASRSDPHVTIHVSRRAQPLPLAASPGGFAEPILGLATALGLQSSRARTSAIDVIVHASDAALVEATEPYLWPLALTVGAITILSFLFARIVTQQALRPLVQVQAALERFASGDIRPQPIAASQRSSLGRLAIAYNGAIARMQEAFAERERANASMRQFIADAGHQLRTPLTVVRGFIAILRKGELRTPQDRDRILETMNRQSALMGSLIDKLMWLERWEDAGTRTQPEAIDVARLVSDVVTPLAEAHPERALRISASSFELSAIDPIDLSHAVTNVVDNALKYTNGAIDITVATKPGHVVIEIRDEGPGMSTQEVRHAFDRFFRGSRRDIEGTGLGLSIARRAIERAGGTLELESSLAEGSRVTITLPATGARAPAPEFEATHV